MESIHLLLTGIIALFALIYSGALALRKKS